MSTVPPRSHPEDELSLKTSNAASSFAPDGGQGYDGGEQGYGAFVSASENGGIHSFEFQLALLQERLEMSAKLLAEKERRIEEQSTTLATQTEQLRARDLERAELAARLEERTNELKSLRTELATLREELAQRRHEPDEAHRNAPPHESNALDTIRAKLDELVSHGHKASEVSGQNGDIPDDAALRHRVAAAAELLELYRTSRRYRFANWLGNLLRWLRRQRPTEPESLLRLQSVLGVPDGTAAKPAEGDGGRQNREWKKWHDRGVSACQKRDYQAAETSLRKAIAQSPNPGPSYLWLARTYRSAGRLADAALAADEAHKRQPGLATFEELGRIALARGEYDTAKEHLLAAIRTPECGGRPYFHLARLARTRGEFSWAAELIAKACELLPDNQEVASFRALVDGDINVYVGETRPSLAPRKQTPRSGSILHLLEQSLPHRQSGYTLRSHYILTSQHGAGWSPTALTRPGFPRDIDVERFSPLEHVDEIPYRRLKIEGEPRYNQRPLDAYLQHFAEQVLGYAGDIGCEIIHAHSNFKNGLVARAVAEALDVPWIYEVRGLWEDTQVSRGVTDESGERYAHFRSLEEECVRSADAVVTISQTLRSEFISRGADPERIFVVPNAIDPEKFPVIERDTSLSDSWDLGEGPTIGYISSFVSYEGISLLIEAFATLHARLPHARLLLVGDGDERMALQTRARELGVADAVRFTGRVAHDEVLAYYSLIDLFVVPRLPWRVCQVVTPLKPYEAMATGRAVVVSDVAALAEMVREDETGVSFRAGDADDLARILEELCENQEKRERLGRTAAEWVRQQRTWSAVCAEYERAYRTANEHHRRRK